MHLSVTTGHLLLGLEFTIQRGKAAMSLGGARRLLKCLCCWCALAANLTHTLL